jgi:hypothetical protein
MTDERYKGWDVALKVLGAIGFAAAAVVGFLEYRWNTTQTIALEASKLDSEQHKLFFDKQIEYYLDVTNTVAGIATNEDPRVRSALIQKFKALYYGPMVILEHRGDSPQFREQTGAKYAHDANVEKHMVAVFKCISVNCANLKNESLELADACRFALSVSWENRVDDLKTTLSNARKSQHEYTPDTESKQ